MADRNRYQRQQRDYNDRGNQRGYGRGRQEEQFQADYRDNSDDYSSGYGQMGDDQDRGSYGGGYEDSNYRSDRSGSSSWRDDRSSYGNQDRDYRGGYGDNMQGGYGQGMGGGYDDNRSGGYGRGNYNDRGRSQFGSFNSESYRTGGDVGSRRNSGYSRGMYGAAGAGDYYRRGYGDNDRGFFDKAGDEVASWFGDDDAERRREMDHRGRGPTNYTRSDSRILEDCCDRLTDDGRVDARNIEVTVNNGEVTLDGTVDSRRDKRRAEDVVDGLSGVGHVQNNLRISDRDRNGDRDRNRDQHDDNDLKGDATNHRTTGSYS